MIRTIAELLEAFRLKEVAMLDNQNIKHPPTIGLMYEGLTQEMLRMALPENLDLRVVSGFITDENDENSPQIDCMLVSGEGMLIPYTDNFRYDLDQVIAVIEVKKNLYSGKLAEAYQNLLNVKKLSLKNLKDKDVSRKQFRDAFYNLVGEDPFSYEDFSVIPIWKKQIGLALNIESLIPIRIAIGYHGFASEKGLRKGFLDFINKNTGEDGYGPISFPNLIISGSSSLVKLNFMPYGIRIASRESLYDLFGLSDVDTSTAPISGENMWPIYASYPENPLLLLLELIWTRLEYTQHIRLFGNDLGVEALRPLILAKAMKNEGVVGWHYEYIPFSKKALANLPTSLTWKPIEINDEQFKIISTILAHNESGLEGLDIEAPKLLDIFDSKQALNDAIQSTIKTGVAIIEDNKLKLLTRKLIVVFLDGKIMIGDDNEGMFTRWISIQQQSPPPPKNMTSLPSHP